MTTAADKKAAEKAAEEANSTAAAEPADTTEPAAYVAVKDFVNGRAYKAGEAIQPEHVGRILAVKTGTPTIKEA